LEEGAVGAAVERRGDLGGSGGSWREQQQQRRREREGREKSGGARHRGLLLSRR
jgi:hypothetical protein